MSTSKDAKLQTEYLRTVYEPDAEGESVHHLIEYLCTWSYFAILLTLVALYSYTA